MKFVDVVRPRLHLRQAPSRVGRGLREQSARSSIRASADRAGILSRRHQEFVDEGKFELGGWLLERRTVPRIDGHTVPPQTGMTGEVKTYLRVAILSSASFAAMSSADVAGFTALSMARIRPSLPM